MKSLKNKSDKVVPQTWSKPIMEKFQSSTERAKIGRTRPL